MLMTVANSFGLIKKFFQIIIVSSEIDNWYKKKKKIMLPRESLRVPVSTCEEIQCQITDFFSSIFSTTVGALTCQGAPKYLENWLHS